ncbi:MAG: TPM domain-containing protein [Spirochaetaceae bacterium]|jgi:uncharacterized protein|nr:TPM domain-containing protein [Spirochaetaceae bacterium]
MYRRLLPGLFALCAALSLSAQARGTLPEPSGYVNDFAGVMDAGDLRAAEALASALETGTGAQLAVVTVESYAPYPSLDDFSLALAGAWGIGGRNDDGVLLILAVRERRVKIEVGYGLEGAIPDSAAGRILDTAVIPDFRQDHFSGGLLKGMQAIAAAVAREKGVDPAELNLSAPAPSGEDPPLGLLILFVLPSLFWFGMAARLGRRRRGFYFTNLNSGGFRPGNFGSSGGFRSPGSSGSGFSGFRGGGFGGGGASRGF